MRRVLSTCLILGLTGCSALSAPSPYAERGAAAEAAPAPAPAPTPTPAPTPAPAPAPAPPQPSGERIEASHILVAYAGGQRAAAEVKRTKEEAKKLAEGLLARAKKGEDFAALATASSDDKGSGSRGGSLGAFGRGMMVKPFEDAAFALKPGEVSGLVESPFGFHIIKRTK